MAKYTKIVVSETEKASSCMLKLPTIAVAEHLIKRAHENEGFALSSIYCLIRFGHAACTDEERYVVKILTRAIGELISTNE